METNIINTKVIAFSTVAALLGAGFAMAMSASAAGPQGGLARGTCDPERHEAVEKAMEDGDYEAWKELHGGRGRIASVVNEDNFDTFVAMHEAMESGDTEKAAELREELGLNASGHRGGGRGGMHRGMGAGDGVQNNWGN